MKIHLAEAQAKLLEAFEYASKSPRVAHPPHQPAEVFQPKEQ